MTDTQTSDKNGQIPTVKESLTTDPLAELRSQIGKIFVQNDLRTDQRAISELMQLLTTALEEQRAEVARIAHNLYPISGKNANKHNKAVLQLSNYVLTQKEEDR